jgi:hypothetical protein
MAALVLSASAAMAQQCVGDRVGGPDDPEGTLRALMEDTIACGHQVWGDDQWQEEHRANGDLVERARGPNHPIDPSRRVGRWRTQDTGIGQQVCYRYGSQEYCFAVHDNGDGTYTFCDEAGSPVAVAEILPLRQSCGF